MRRRIFEVRERLYYLRSLRTEYLRIQHRYYLRRTNRWVILKSLWKWLLAFIGICLVVLAILLGYRYTWTGFSHFIGPSGELLPGKKLWDWMELLLIPGLLGLLAYVFTSAQKSRELAVALLNKREQALQQYFDYMTHLLVEQDFSDEQQLEGASRIARARTMAVLEMLDGRQKGHLLRFLVEAQLIHQKQPFFSMRRADLRGLVLDPGSYNHCDLRGANLDGASLPWCNFNSAHMTGITMQNADLESADFSSSDLDYALLTKSDLYHACLRRAHLIKVDCRDANLQRADLSEAGIRTARMKGANLRAANLTKAYLRCADLSFANLTDADLTEADLTHANLYGANLRNAKLAGTDLTGSNATPRQLRKAKSTEGAKLPATANE
jgi:uncharacterized protein YjbI with pentapeptide repeats